MQGWTANSATKNGDFAAIDAGRHIRLIPSVQIRYLLLAVLACLPLATHAADRPNIVWIVSEDNSIHYLRHFFEGGAEAPNIEALAAHGLTYDHAFSNAPVCSVARTTLATGCYGPRIGTQYHRRYAMAPLPDGLRMFPAYLRDDGYYTTNNSKTDYNATPTKDVWDDSSTGADWRNRADKSQPFFHMQSHGESHESSLHFNQQAYENEKTSHDPAAVALADYFPDTPLFRYTHARYLDRMTDIDDIVGKTVAKLETDGVLEDTFIFYFGDHGGVLPRGKGYIYESGLHVPLVIRVPENFKHLANAELGARIGGFVEFVDFGPTALQLAGVAVPQQVDGTAFLGKGIDPSEVETRDETFGYADRFDEKYELIRSLRKGRYQYIRHYQPWLPDGLQNNYRYKSLAYTEWRELFQAGKLDGLQAQFFQPKAIEALYDCEDDPHQVNNLAADPVHAETLKKLRGRLSDRLKAMPDLSFYPESEMLASAMENPVAYGQAHKAEIAELVDIADLALMSFAEAKADLTSALASDHPMQRYWAAMACSAFGKDAEEFATQVQPLLNDDRPIVRVRAAEFLGMIGSIDPQTELRKVVNTAEDPVVVTEALNSVVYFQDCVKPAYPIDVATLKPTAKGGDIDDRINYLKGDPYPAKAKKDKPKGKGKNKV